MGRLFIAVLLLAACSTDTVYHHFESTSDEGWDKEDTLTMQTDEMQETGTYELTLDVRTTEEYPYQDLSLMVEETLLTSKAKRLYPVTLQIATRQGERNEEGLAYSEFRRELSKQYIRKGEKIRFRIYHKMRRLVLPGVKDVGIKLKVE
ncbi:MAG: gliding motility lipoprotein GldH [Prevotella sp.]|nr:gliding motility lipoprotein GldH [Prevotella sp.]MBR1839023.1 gliding motility lipoprotein GldH [Prevotella sp.]